MRVLVLSQHYWPESFRINEVVESLQAAGCMVSVLTGQPNYPDGKVFAGYRAAAFGPQQHSAGYTIHRVPLVPRGSGSATRLAMNYLSFIASASTVGAWMLRGQRFDLIFVYGTSPILQALPAIVLRRLKRAKLVTWVQDLWPQSLEATGFVRNPRALAAVAAVVRWIYSRCDLLLVQSAAFVPTVRAMAGATPVEYHPNPGEQAFGEAASAGPPALRLAAGFNVVFAGNLGTVQALHTVLDAAELLRADADIRWVLVGSGTRSAWLSQEVVRRRLDNVHLAGRFAPEDMPGILAQASALLVSLCRGSILSQTVPSKLQAYMAAGRPLIASLDGEGARVVERAQAGVVCPAEDAGALAQAVLSLRMASPQVRDAMGEAGRRYYREHFAPALLAGRLAQRFTLLCAGRPTAGDVG